MTQDKMKQIDELGDSPAQLADAQALSALMDNEATAIEIRRLMGRLADKPELQETWKRYQLIHSAMQQTMHVRPAVDLLKGANGIQAALAAEAVPLRASGHQGNAPKQGRFWKLAGQGAIAASVAVMAVIGVSGLQVAGVDEASSSANVASVANAPLPELAGEYQPSSLERTVRLDPAARTRLQQAVYQFSTTQSTVDFPGELILSLPADEPADLTDSDQVPVSP